VHRPVRAERLAELPGAIERIDDPDPLGGEPGRVVLALLGQDRVGRAAPGKLGGEELVRRQVARLTQFLARAGRIGP
jgi:hypothetical protein